MENPRPAATPMDMAVVTAICFGLFIFSSIEAVMHDFPAHRITDDRLLSLIALEIGAALLALGYLRVRGHDIRGLFPSPTLPGMLLGGGLYLLTVMLAVPLEALLVQFMPTLREGADTIQTVALSPLVIVAVSLVNGIYEEAFLLGFLQRGLAPSERHFAVGTVLLVRISYHLYQGPTGVLFVIVFGAIVGYYYFRTGKLWPAIVAHITGDVVGLVMH